MGGIGFERALSVKELVNEIDPSRNRVVRVWSSMTLGEAKSLCMKRRKHMLLVGEDPKDEDFWEKGKEGPKGKQDQIRQYQHSNLPVKGIITMEDILEEILKEEIVDEFDKHVSNEASGLNLQRAEPSKLLSRVVASEHLCEKSVNAVLAVLKKE